MNRSLRILWLNYAKIQPLVDKMLMVLFNISCVLSCLLAVIVTTRNLAIAMMRGSRLSLLQNKAHCSQKSKLPKVCGNDRYQRGDPLDFGRCLIQILLVSDLWFQYTTRYTSHHDNHKEEEDKPLKRINESYDWSWESMNEISECVLYVWINVETFLQIYL